MGLALEIRRQTPGELWAEALDPGARLTVDEWADEHRELTKKGGAAEPGRWRTDRVPYARFAMRLMSVSHPAERIILQWASQTSKTQTVLNFIGYCVDHEPAWIMLVLGSLNTAKRYSRLRIDDLIASTPSLRAKVAERRSRDDANSRLLKDFPGGSLLIAGANSPRELREASIRYLILEEMDGYEDEAGREGDPVALAIRRTAAFRGRRKIVMVSTPGRDPSRIDRERRSAEQEWRYHVPCPTCGHFQELVRSQLRYEVQTVFAGEESREPSGDREDVALATQHPEIAGTRYECAGCKALISETSKRKMIEAGEWVRIRNHGEKSVALHLSALYSTIGFSWGEAAAMTEAAKADASQMQPLINTVDALPYAEPRQAPAWQPLYNRRQEYGEGVVQPGCRILTMAIDVQENRLEVEVRGWGRDLRYWSLLYRVIPGDPLDSLVWNEVDQLLKTDWPTAGGDGSLPIWCCAVDSGKYPQRVYKWARTHPQPDYRGGIVIRDERCVMVVKGRDEWRKTLLTATKISEEERKRGIRIVGVGVSKLKAEHYRWLRSSLRENGSEPEGYGHWPTSYDEKYFAGLVAEHLVVKRINGRPREVWELPSGVRNEPLDLHVYGRAAAAACGVDRWLPKEWDRFEKSKHFPKSLLVEPEWVPQPRSPSPELKLERRPESAGPLAPPVTTPPASPVKRRRHAGFRVRSMVSPWMRR